MWKRLYLESCTCSCENGKCLERIIFNLVIFCDKVIEEIKTVPTISNEKK